MNNDIQRAKSFLNEGATCAIVKDVEIFTTDRRGIAPLLELAEQGKDLSGYSAADKIVGKAAALLYVLTGVEEVYSEVMSRPAAEVLKLNGVKYSCDKLVDYIVNRKGDGMCPMERTVENISDPATAARALRQTLNNLSKG